MHAYILVCLWALWKIYVGFVVDIHIKILGAGRGVSLVLLFAGAIFLLEVFSQASSQQHG